MRTTVLDVTGAVDLAAPESWAAEWDKVGLQVGDINATVKRALVTLDVTEEVLDEAIETKAKLIIVHHPVISEPLTCVCPDGNKVVWRAVRKGIAIYVAHTNLDVAPEIGTADALADALGLRETEVILGAEKDSVKIVVFVPEEAAEKVVDAMALGLAGRIGDYHRCAFLTSGTGTFQPGDRAHPHIGVPGRQEEVEELRVEMVCPRGSAGFALAALRAAHPYEEPAYDVYPLEETATGRGYTVTGICSPASLSG